MNLEKLNRVNLCLYATSAIKIASALYIIVTMSSLTPQGLMDNFSGLISGAFIVAIALSVFTVFIVDGLKKQKLWAWVSALSIFLLALPSFALPAAVIGILSLLDVEVRTSFLKELDLKF